MLGREVQNLGHLVGAAVVPGVSKSTQGKHIPVGEDDALCRALTAAEPHCNTTLAPRLHGTLTNDTVEPEPRPTASCTCTWGRQA